MPAPSFALSLLILFSITMSSLSWAAPLCSVVLLHTSPLIENVSDIRHAGAVDINLRIEQKNLFENRTVFPVAPALDAPSKLPLDQIHFMQNGISSRFSNNKGSVIDLARALETAKFKHPALPPIRVWKDQNEKIWSLDHRRLAAMILAGKIEEVPVVWANPREVYKDSLSLKT